MLGDNQQACRPPTRDPHGQLCNSDDGAICSRSRPLFSSFQEREERSIPVMFVE